MSDTPYYQRKAQLDYQNRMREQQRDQPKIRLPDFDIPSRLRETVREVEPEITNPDHIWIRQCGQCNGINLHADEPTYNHTIGGTRCASCGRVDNNAPIHYVRAGRTQSPKEKTDETSRGFNFAKAISPENWPT